jgi:hypothetical protein
MLILTYNCDRPTCLKNMCVCVCGGAWDGCMEQMERESERDGSLEVVLYADQQIPAL